MRNATLRRAVSARVVLDHGSYRLLLCHPRREEYMHWRESRASCRASLHQLHQMAKTGTYGGIALVDYGIGLQSKPVITKSASHLTLQLPHWDLAF